MDYINGARALAAVTTRLASAILRSVARGVGIGAALSGCWLLVVVCAAAKARRRPPPPPSPDRRCLVLIPAHDEQMVLGRTLDSLEDQDLGRDAFDIVVVAHNCRDDTAALAAARGAHVWKLDAHDRPGKGAVLSWAFDRLREGPIPECVIVLDADCLCSPNLVSAIASMMADGATAVQVRNVVENPELDSAAALRAGAIILMNVVRPMGLGRLGLSAGLRGTGMAFATDLVRRMSWTSQSLAEDLEQHMILVSLGERVAFANHAEVRSPLPLRREHRRSQSVRWEGGRSALARDAVACGVLRGMHRRSASLILTAFDTALPPQANLMVMSLSVIAAGYVGRDALARRLGYFSVVSQTAFVIVGLRVGDAPPSAYRALLASPSLVLEKARVYRQIRRRGLPRWQRSAR